MAELQKVQSRGQVTLNVAIRRAAGIEQGDNDSMSVVGSGTVLIRSIGRRTLRDILEEHGPGDELADIASLRSNAEERAALEFIERMVNKDA